jgi:NAD(P)-dependent dehydrogenase (short-subunit alcohol dehydrogenase family)
MTEHKPLAGRVALVAGATRGAGRAMAVDLARAGRVRLRDWAEQPNGRTLRDRPTRNDRGDRRPDAGRRRRR